MMELQFFNSGATKQGNSLLPSLSTSSSQLGASLCSTSKIFSNQESNDDELKSYNQQPITQEVLKYQFPLGEEKVICNYQANNGEANETPIQEVMEIFGDPNFRVEGRMVKKVRYFSCEEHDECMIKNLCFFCFDQWNPDHICPQSKNLYLYSMDIGENSSEDSSKDFQEETSGRDFCVVNQTQDLQEDVQFIQKVSADKRFDNDISCEGDDLESRSKSDDSNGFVGYIQTTKQSFNHEPSTLMVSNPRNESVFSMEEKSEDIEPSKLNDKINEVLIPEKHIVLVNTQQISWISDHSFILGGKEEEIFFEYGEILAESIEKQLLQQGFIATIPQEKALKQLHGGVKHFSGKVELMSRLINLNVIILMGVELQKNSWDFMHKKSTSFEGVVGVKGIGEYNLILIQGDKALHKFLHTINEVRTLENDGIRVKQLWEGFFALEDSVGHTEGIMDELESKINKCLCKEGHKILEKTLFIIWNWYYKDSGALFEELIEDYKIELSQNPQFCLHPGCWNMEWKIAWMCNDFSSFYF